MQAEAAEVASRKRRRRAYEKALAEARGNAFGIADGAREQAKAAADGEASRRSRPISPRSSQESEARIADIKTRALAEVGAIASDAAAGGGRGAERTCAPAPRRSSDAVGEALAERKANV